MPNKKLLLVPALFTLALAPVFIVALLTFQPEKTCPACDCSTIPAGATVHTHGIGIAAEIKGDLQLIFNVSPAAQLYQVVNGNLELCGEISDGDLRHVTLDVLDARLALGERLPVSIDLTLRRADTHEIVVEAGAPAMYAPGHGYHFGDNFLLPGGVDYTWTAVISPVKALRQDGAQTLWLEPVTWEGRFTLNADGSVAGQTAAVQPIGQVSKDGVHVQLGYQRQQRLYAVGDDGTTRLQDIPPGSLYFVVDVTDHILNYEEKLPGAVVKVIFRQGSTIHEMPFDPVISPLYGFHYGANVALEPGQWQITVEVSDLDFLRHAGAAVNLARDPVRGSFEFTAP